MHAQHLGSDAIWARGSQFTAEAQAARLAKEARRQRTASLKPSWPVDLAIRPLEPADIEHLRALFGRLSARSRWLRYLAPVRKLTEPALRKLACIDHELHEALGAFDGGELVAAAHYFREREDPARAEISVEVADSHQRHGIGPRLLNELAALARQRGITSFNATALRENVGVLSMVHNSDWPSVVTPAGSELDIALMIPAQAQGVTMPDVAPGPDAVLRPCDPVAAAALIAESAGSMRQRTPSQTVR